MIQIQITELGNHHHTLVLELFHHLKNFPNLICSQSPFSPPQGPGNHWPAFSKFAFSAHFM